MWASNSSDHSLTTRTCSRIERLVNDELMETAHYHLPPCFEENPAVDQRKANMADPGTEHAAHVTGFESGYDDLEINRE